jgi:dipeptidase E
VERKEVRVAFGGGGEEEDERLVLDRFAAWIGAGRVLYIPLASDPPFDASVAWVTSVMASRGGVEIVVGMSAEAVIQAIPTSDGVFIGGGNTYKLLNALRAARADVALADAALRGLPLYGGSAGAILLGNDIDTAGWDDAKAEGSMGTGGLGLALGYSIACHYEDSHETRLRQYVLDRNEHVVAIPERGGLIRTGDALTAAGPDPVAVFVPGRSVVSVDVGASLPRH